MPTVRALDLFQAYSQNQLPKEGGYIVSSFLEESSAYSKYEVVAYNGVKSLYLAEDGLTFQSDGNKLFVLTEPMGYPHKSQEPFRRTSKEQIPHRFSELEIVTARNQTKVMISKEPIITYSAFTIMKPSGINFSFVFYNLPDVFQTIAGFFEKTLNKESGVPKEDAAKAAQFIIAGLKRFTIWSN